MPRRVSAPALRWRRRRLVWPPPGRAGGAGPGKEGRNLDHFALELDAFDEAAIRAHLEACGVAPGEVETRYGARGSGPSMYVRDPDDNVVELKGPPDAGAG